jgi:hydrogenase/urease accessory protein HupE
MLMIAIAVLVLGTLYAVSIAPPDQRVIVAVVVIGLTAAGYGVGLAITKPGTDERTYYSIAAAIAGTMVAFVWISNKRKSWPKKDDKK